MKHRCVSLPLSALLVSLSGACFSDASSDPLAGDDSGAGETDGPDGSSSDGTTGGTTGDSGDSGDSDDSGDSGSSAGGTSGGTTGDDPTGGTTGDDPSGGTTGGTTGDDPTGGTTGDGTGGSTGGAVPDGVPPEVLSVEPEDHALGVPVDTNIVITFSEPMDEASVEAAWAGELLPLKTDNVTFSWNQDSTVLTVDPINDLLMAEGPPGTAAKYYSYALDLGVMDQSGELMAQEFTAALSTIRRIKDTLMLVPELTGTVTSDGMSVQVDANKCWVGDNYKDYPMLCGVTFDLTQLDGEPTVIEKASIDWALAGMGYSGQPLDKLGGVQRWVLSYDSLAEMDTGLLPEPDNMGMVFEAYTPTAVLTDEMAAFGAAIENGDSRLQYRLQIDGDWNVEDETADYWSIQSINFPHLDVEYLTP